MAERISRRTRSSKEDLLIGGAKFIAGVALGAAAYKLVHEFKKTARENEKPILPAEPYLPAAKPAEVSVENLTAERSNLVQTLGLVLRSRAEDAASRVANLLKEAELAQIEPWNPVLPARVSQTRVSQPVSQQALVLEEKPSIGPQVEIVTTSLADLIKAAERENQDPQVVADAKALLERRELGSSPEEIVTKEHGSVADIFRYLKMVGSKRIHSVGDALDRYLQPPRRNIAFAALIAAGFTGGAGAGYRLLNVQASGESPTSISAQTSRDRIPVQVSAISEVKRFSQQMDVRTLAKIYALEADPKIKASFLEKLNEFSAQNIEGQLAASVYPVIGVDVTSKMHIDALQFALAQDQDRNEALVARIEYKLNSLNGFNYGQNIISPDKDTNVPTKDEINKIIKEIDSGKKPS